MVLLKVSIERISKDQTDQVIIRCYKITSKVDCIANYVRSMSDTLAGYKDERISQISVHDIFYIEAVNNHVFAYTEKQVFEIKIKLYEFENIYERQRFLRCSKSMVVNLMKIESVYPIFNGRFAAKLFNGEEIIISRQYVPSLKNVLSGGAL